LREVLIHKIPSLEIDDKIKGSACLAMRAITSAKTPSSFAYFSSMVLQSFVYSIM
jgi:hypothetical protein